ncbi:MAG: DUF1365 domain-containing protein [Salinarimonas sp.]
MSAGTQGPEGLPDVLRGEAPACLYVGDVMHARLRPRTHRFRYRVLALWIDLDRLEAAGRLGPLFSVGRANLVSFRPEDHGARGALPLAVWARATFAAHGIAAARVRLLAYPRILGYAFNPIALHYGFAADGRPVGTIAEVRNTFGERHVYVLPAGAGRAQATKAFHVSPFLAMDHVYRFGLAPPGEEARVTIVAHDDSGPVLTALFAGRRRALTTGGLLAALARTPLMTAKVVCAIHWEALRLWAKGVAVVPHPRRAR